MALSESQLSQLRAKLDDRHELLIREVREELERSENQQYVELINGAPADIGDQSVGDALADLNLAIIDRHIREIRDIEQAKTRMKEGGITTCIECGQEIELKRLLACPTAKRCLLCQQQRERTYAHEGTPTL